MEYTTFVEIIAEELMADLDCIRPESLLVEELGMQSIDVVQIVERIAEALGKPIEQIDFDEVETVEEFYWELVQGGNDGEDSVVAGMAAIAAAGAKLPHELALREWLPNDIQTDVTTLVGMLARRASVSPERPAVSMDGVTLSFAELFRDIGKMAAALRFQGVRRGDRVLVVMHNCLEFFAVYYGIQHLRAVAVPVFHASRPDRVASVARQAGAQAIVTLRPLARPVRKRLVETLDDDSVMLLDVPSLATLSGTMDGPLPMPEPDDLAMLQFTSGTTGNSKGVMLTHRALIANIRQMITTGRMTRDDSFVSWLPVYHDMGLITMTMCPFYLGARLTLLEVSLKPQRWFEAIEEHKGTITAAPDFAYRYALRLGGNLDRYDLTSLRFALVAAEPVRARTIARFEAAMGIPGVLKPGYGLAECSVGVAFWPFNRDIQTDAEGCVSVGYTLPGIELEIRGEAGEAVPAGTWGEICLRSPSQTLGYFEDAEATNSLFTHDGYVRTGDVGYVDPDGALYIVDRSKNLIIVAGRNLAPKEIEELVDAIPGVAASMAVGVDDGGDAGEQLHVVVESVEDDLEPSKATELARVVSRAVQSHIGIRPERVHIRPKRAIPRTYNGKLQYAVMRKRLLEGAID